MKRNIKKFKKLLDKVEEIWYNIKAAFESGKTLKEFEKTFEKALDKRSKVWYTWKVAQDLKKREKKNF